MPADDTISNEIPAILIDLWENWRSLEGVGPCNGCSAHWSNRKDLPGKPDSRMSSFGTAPYYGIGSLNPEVVILGREPGPIKSHNVNPQNNPLERPFTHRYNADVSTVTSEGSYSIRSLEPLFVGIEETGLGVYWSQLRKCNERRGASDEEKAAVRARCCGTAPESEGYLKQELNALSPQVVVTLGKDTFEQTAKLYNIDVPDARNFSALTVSGESRSGFRSLPSDTEGLSVVPAPHPGQGWRHANEALESSGRGFSSKREYYDQLAEDICSRLSAI